MQAGEKLIGIALPKGKHHYALLMQSKEKRIQELEALLNNQGQLI